MSVKRIYLFITLALIVLSCKKDSNNAEGTFNLNVKVAKIADNTKVLLKKQENNTTITIDSTIVKNGTFEFKGNIETPTIYGVFIDSVRGGIFPLMESGTVNIEAHRDSLSAAKITGSELNDELSRFREDTKKIVSKINDLFPQVQKARAENDSEKLEELNQKMRAVNDENTQFSLNYTKDNPDSYISAIILQSLLRMPTIDKDSVAIIYNNFSDKVKKSDHSKNIAKYIEMSIPKKDSIK